MLDVIRDWLSLQGFDASLANIVARGLIVFLILVISMIVYLLAKHFILKGIAAIIGRTETQWDDIILQNKVFNRLARIALAIVLYMSLPVPFSGYDWLISLITGLLLIYMIVMGILALDAALNAVLIIYTGYEVSNRIPIKGFIQVIKIVIYFTGAIFIISILMNKTPIYLFSSLGALTAVLMFIFKDAILGFIAGIQLSANRMGCKR